MGTSFHRVTSARLLLSPTNGKEWQLPVGRYEVGFARNELPQASVRPALGQAFNSGKQITLQNVKEGMPAKLYLTRDGKERLVFDGFVQRIGTTDNSSVFNRYTSAEITLKHRSAVLAGAQTSSVVYAKKSEVLYAAMTQYPYRVNPLEKDSGSGDQGSITTAIIAAMVRRELGGNDVELAQYPAEVLKFLTTKTVDSNYPVANAAVKGLVRAYGPANLRPLSLEPVTAVSTMYEYWCGGLNSNVWAALSTTAAQFFLSVLPFSNGIYLANPLALLQTPNKRLYAGDIISMTTTLNARDFPEPVDGVVLQVPCPWLGDAGQQGFDDADPATRAMMGEYRFVYPPSSVPGADTGAVDEISVDRYYHYLQMPQWLQQVNGPFVSFVDRGKGRAGLAKGKLNVGDAYKEIGPAVAREMYAAFKCTRAAMELTLPYREDLMPGTVVAVENTTDRTISFLGKTLYGMIESVSFVCDVIQSSPTIVTRVTLVAVRSETDNQDPPAGFGIDKSAMFEGAWVGMDLQGNLLADLPDYTPLAESTEPNSSVPTA